MRYDFGLAWNWEWDAAFVADLETACLLHGVSFHAIHNGNVEECLEAAGSGDLRWKLLLDRAWESDHRFRIVNEIAAACGTRLLNPPDWAAALGNKAATHARLDRAGVPVPRTIDFMPGDWSDTILTAHSEGWSRPLWLKPATRGGGDGVLSLADIPPQFPLTQEWSGERFVLQESAAPVTLRGRPAWFRVFTLFGHVFPFWWDPGTHRFTPLTAAEEAVHDLACVRKTVMALGSVARLEIFSSEISVIAPGRAVVVDPVNDPVDFRRQSQADDGIPDESLAAMIETIASQISGIISEGSLLFAGREQAS